MLVNINVCVDRNILYLNPNALKVCIGDCSDREFIASFNGVPASLYNPPFEAITAFAEGDRERFRSLYFHYLNTNDSVKEFTIAIIRSILMGKEIILYLDPNEYNMFFDVLAAYFTASFGLRIGNPMLGIYGEINDNMCQNIVSYLYLTNDMDVDTFFRLYYSVFTQPIIDKLIDDLNMRYTIRYNYTLEQYQQAFDNIRKSIVLGHKRPKLLRAYKVDSI